MVKVIRVEGSWSYWNRDVFIWKWVLVDVSKTPSGICDETKKNILCDLTVDLKIVMRLKLAG
jgi:hypothetical protein